MKIRDMVYTAVNLACDNLTSKEMTEMNSILLAGTDPRNGAGYHKISGLFTKNDGTKMHIETQLAFVEITTLRSLLEIEKELMTYGFVSDIDNRAF